MTYIGQMKYSEMSCSHDQIMIFCMQFLSSQAYRRSCQNSKRIIYHYRFENLPRNKCFCNKIGLKRSSSNKKLTLFKEVLLKKNLLQRRILQRDKNTNIFNYHLRCVHVQQSSLLNICVKHCIKYNVNVFLFIIAHRFENFLLIVFVHGDSSTGDRELITDRI